MIIYTLRLYKLYFSTPSSFILLKQNQSFVKLITVYPFSCYNHFRKDVTAVATIDDLVNPPFLKAFRKTYERINALSPKIPSSYINKIQPPPYLLAVQQQVESQVQICV